MEEGFNKRIDSIVDNNADVNDLENNGKVIQLNEHERISHGRSSASSGMDGRENYSRDAGGAAVIFNGFKAFLILGWVSAAFAAFIHPLFAIAGIVFGVLVNRHEGSKGNAIIITNIVVAALNILFGLFLVIAMRRMMFGI